MTIYIDHIGGAHGNYLEFICNKFRLNVKKEDVDFRPFKENGTAHFSTPQYNKSKLFTLADSLWVDGNPIYNKFKECTNSTIIYIKINPDDLLTFMQISLLRAAESGIDSDELEINTFSKLQLPSHSNVTFKHLKEFFFNDTITDDYNAVKDKKWPAINSIEEYYALPSVILNECEVVHKITPITLSETTPNCPRKTLREFFTYGFMDTSNHGILKRQNDLLNSNTYQNNKVYEFKYNTFYDVNLFKNELIKLFDFLNITLAINDDFYKIHNEFLSRQPYKNSKFKCDNIVRNILTSDNNIVLKLSLLEESYVSAIIETATGKPMYINDDRYFRDTNEIRKYIA